MNQKRSTHAESLINTDVGQVFPHLGTLADMTSFSEVLSKQNSLSHNISMERAAFNNPKTPKYVP